MVSSWLQNFSKTKIIYRIIGITIQHIVQKENKIIKSKSDLNRGDNIKITLVDGDITAVIEE